MRTVRFADVDVANAISHKGKDARYSKAYGNMEYLTDNIKSKVTMPKKHSKKRRQTTSVPKVCDYVCTYVNTSSGVVTLRRHVKVSEVKDKFPTVKSLYWERADGTFSHEVVVSRKIKRPRICR